MTQDWQTAVAFVCVWSALSIRTFPDQCFFGIKWMLARPCPTQIADFQTIADTSNWRPISIVIKLTPGFFLPCFHVVSRLETHGANVNPRCRQFAAMKPMKLLLAGVTATSSLLLAVSTSHAQMAWQTNNSDSDAGNWIATLNDTASYVWRSVCASRGASNQLALQTVSLRGHGWQRLLFPLPIVLFWQRGVDAGNVCLILAAVASRVHCGTLKMAVDNSKTDLRSTSPRYENWTSDD